jgi:hypothetical protein
MTLHRLATAPEDPRSVLRIELMDAIIAGDPVRAAWLTARAEEYRAEREKQGNP